MVSNNELAVMQEVFVESPAAQGETTFLLIVGLEMLYPVLFACVTFCLLARLKKSASNSSLYLSWNVKNFAIRRSGTHVLGRPKVLRPIWGRRVAPPEPLMPAPMPPAREFVVP